MKINQSQKNILSGWRYFQLEEIAKTSSGGTPKSGSDEYYTNGNVPWLTSGEVKKGRISTFDNYITKKGLENSSAKIFPPKTVLVAMYGVTAGQVGILEKEASTNQAICGILPNEKYSSLFLYHYFTTKTQQLLMMGTGAAQPNISQEILRNLDINLPPLPEQTRIVSVLETWDKTIENLNKKIEIKKQIKKGLMQDLLTSKKRLGGFKDKWKEEKLGNLIIKQEKTDRQSGTSLDAGKYPFFNNSSKGFDQYINDFDFDGEMLIANTGGVAYFDYYFGKFAVMSDCFVFSTKQNCKFLFYNLKKLELLINHEGFTGSGIKHLDKKFFFKLKILLPSIKEQDAIAGILNTESKEILDLEKKLGIIKDQKKYLLNNLITGVIRTPENLLAKVK